MPVSQKNTLGENLAETLDIGNYTTNGQTIVAQNGDSGLNLRVNKNGFIRLGSDLVGRTKAELFLTTTAASLFFNPINNDFFVTVDGTNCIMSRSGATDRGFVTLNATSLRYLDIAFATAASGLKIIENDTTSRTSAVSQRDCVFVHSGDTLELSTINQQVLRTVAISGKGLTAKTNDTLYCNQISFQESGNLFDNIIVYPNSATQDNTHTLQNKSGTLAHVEDEFATTTVSPPVLTVDQNNYSPTGLSRNCWLRLDSSSPVSITGIDSTGFSDRDRVIVTNVGNNNITFVGNSASSSVGNRFLSQNETLNNNGESIIIMFDATSNGWRLICLHT